MNRCEICDKEIETLATAYRRITGWVQPRKQGGANAVALREETGELAHSWCIDLASTEARLARQGVHPDQLGLT